MNNASFRVASYPGGHAQIERNDWPKWADGSFDERGWRVLTVCDDMESAEIGLAVIEGRMTKEERALWFRKRRRLRVAEGR